MTPLGVRLGFVHFIRRGFFQNQQVSILIQSLLIHFPVVFFLRSFLCVSASNSFSTLCYVSPAEAGPMLINGRFAQGFN